jgi:hypothetical protein
MPLICEGVELVTAFAWTISGEAIPAAAVMMASKIQLTIGRYFGFIMTAVLRDVIAKEFY